MKILFDATSLINLVHGNILGPIVKLPGVAFRVGPIVLSECMTIREQIEQVIANSLIVLLPDDHVDTAVYLDLLAIHRLGPGETECLAAASIGDEIVCSDDGRARKVIANVLAADRVIGCLGLLARASQLGVIEASAALGAYEQMRSRGGFLPEISEGQFLVLAGLLKTGAEG